MVSGAAVVTVAAEHWQRWGRAPLPEEAPLHELERHGVNFTPIVAEARRTGLLKRTRMTMAPGCRGDDCSHQYRFGATPANKRLVALRARVLAHSP